MQVKIKKLHPDAKVPTYGSAGAACFDICVLKGAQCLFVGAVQSLRLAWRLRCQKATR